MRLLIALLFQLPLVLPFEVFAFQEITELDPSISPDGKWVAFRAIKDGNSDIYVSNIDGTKPTRITNWDSMEGLPSWSPDNKKLAFFSNKGGNFNIHTIDIETKETKQITNDSSLNLISFWLESADTLYYTSNNNGNEVRASVLNSGRDILWSTAFEHHNPIKQSKNSATLWGVIKDEKDWEIAAFEPGLEPRIIASNPSRDSEPSPSPDATQVVFSSKRGVNDSWQLYLMNWDGSEIVQLTNSDGRNTSPSWINNREIIFASNQDGGFRLYILNVKSKELRRLKIEW